MFLTHKELINKMNDMVDSSKIYRVRFYDCLSEKDKVSYQTIIEDCGGKIQDHRLNFKEYTIDFFISLEQPLLKFKEKLFAIHGLEPSTDYLFITA